jgi:TP901 family phage tail tape measure protein
MANSVVGALRIDLAMNAGQFRRDAKQVEADLKSLGGAISNISDKINRSSVFITTGMFAAERFASVSKGILDVASSFEKGMSNVSTLIDTNTENLREMSDQVLAIGRRTPVALTDLTQGLFDLRSAGIGAEDQMRLLEGSARLGVAALGTTAETVDIVTSAINAFGLQGEETNRIFDLLFKTTNYGKTTIAQLSRGFGAVAGTVANAGIALDEYLASVSALTTTGLPAAEAHTQIRAAIAGLTRESEIGSKVLKTLGAKTFKELVQQSGGLVGAFEKIRATLQGNDAAMLKLLGSTEALNAVISLTGNQNQSFKKTLDEMRNGADQVNAAFDKQNDTIFAATQRLTNSMQSLGIAMGEVLAPAMKKLAGFVESVTEAFKSLSPETQKMIAFVGVFAAVIGPAVIALGFFANALASLIPVIGALGAAISLLIAAAGPIGLFIAAASVAIGAWSIFRDDIKVIWSDVANSIREKNLDIAKSLIQLDLDVLDTFNNIKNTIADSVASVIKDMASLSLSFFTALDQFRRGAPLADVAKTLTDAMTPAVQTMTGALGDATLASGEFNDSLVAESAALTTNVPITDLATAAKTRHGEAQRFLNQMMREGKQVTEEMATPEEALLARQQKLSTLLMASAISAETYGKAMQKAAFVSLNAYAGMASGIADNLAKAFGNSKAFAIAAAIINTAESVTKTLATYGATPWGIAAAAAAAAAGAAQIATIRKTTKTSSGGGGGGGAPAVNPQAAAPQQQQGVTINLQGERFGRDQVRGLIEEINKAVSDGAVLRVA